MIVLTCMCLALVWLPGHAASTHKSAPHGRFKVMVTGGSGNIGSELVLQLTTYRASAVVVDVRPPPDAVRQHRSVSFYRQDVTDERSVAAIAKHERVQGVIHLAAVSRVQWCLDDEQYCNHVNVMGTRAVMNVANALSSVKWFIFASSREVYGASPTFPVNESTPRAPLNVYGRTKSSAESILEAGFRKPTIVLRLSNVYGGLNDHVERLIPSLLTKGMLNQPMLVTGGNQTMDFSHVSDVVSAFVLAADRLHRKGRSQTASALETPFYDSFNIVSGNATKVGDLVQLVQATTGCVSTVEFVPQDDRFPGHYEADPSKAASVLDFKAQMTDVGVGLSRYRDALRKHWIEKLAAKTQRECAASTQADASMCSLLKQSLEYHELQLERPTACHGGSASDRSRIAASTFCAVDCDMHEACVFNGRCVCTSKRVACVKQ